MNVCIRTARARPCLRASMAPIVERQTLRAKKYDTMTVKLTGESDRAVRS